MGACRLKIKTVFFLVMCFICGLHAKSQYSHLAKKVTVNFTQVPLDQALDEIARKGNFNFSYNSDLINPEKLVTVRVEETKIDKILHDLFGEAISNKEVGNHVILMKNFRHGNKKPASQNLLFHVSGFIVDAETNRKLPDVTIYEVSGRKSVLSGSEGSYSFPMASENKIQGIYFARIGYRDTVIFLNPVSDYQLDISLFPLFGTFSGIPSRPATLQVNPFDSLAIINALVPRKMLVTSDNLQVGGTRAFQVSLIPYVGTNWMNKGAYSTAVSFNLLAGYTGGVDGFELGGLLNIVRNGVSGVQVGGLGNIVGKGTNGLQIGGLFNVNLGHFKGLQLSGLMNFQKDTLSGVQIGGLVNYLEGKMRGVQIGGLICITTGNADGWQIGGLANVAVLDVGQAQIGGLVNYARHIYGFQLGGLVSIASGHVDGLQISGLFNYAKNVNGVQVSAFNFAQTVESGIPIGFFSYVAKGGLHRFELYADETFYGNVAYKTGTNRFYNIFQVGIGTSWMINYMYGIGTSFPLSTKVTLDLNVISGLVFSTSAGLSLHGTLTRFFPAVEYRFGKHLALFGGPVYNLYAFDVARTIKPNGIAPYTFYNQIKGYQRLQMWIGGTAGLRF